MKSVKVWLFSSIYQRLEMIMSLITRTGQLEKIGTKYDQMNKDHGKGKSLRSKRWKQGRDNSLQRIKSYQGLFS